MKKLPLCIFLALSISAHGALQPSFSSKDSRMQHLNFTSADVTNIYAKIGYATAIKLSDDELVVDIAVGFQDGWEVVENGNMIYIKAVSVNTKDGYLQPNADEWRTNLLITTNKRYYAFDLFIDEASSNAKAAYFVVFNYPNEQAQARRNAQAEQQAKINEAKKKREYEAQQSYIQDKLAETTTPKNWDYSMRVGDDSRAIAPTFVYDDGQRTYIGFNSSASIPAVFVYQGKTEMMSNTSVRKDGDETVIVVHKVAERLLLRSGNQAIGIINNSFGQNTTQNETTSPQIKLKIKGN